MDSSGRPAPRRIIEREVELRFPCSTLRLFGESRNVSETGMLIVSEDPKPPGTPILFLFRDFQGKAEVVWRRESEEGALLGLKFTHLEPPARQALEKMMEYAPRY